MKKLTHLISLLAFLTLSLLTVNAESIEYPIQGSVVEAETGNPIAGAQIVISLGFGIWATKIDTLISNSEGFVTDTISLDSSTYGFAHKVTAEGYSSINSYQQIKGSSIDLGIIELSKKQLKTLVISAQAYYSNTTIPVENAELLMYVANEFNGNNSKFDYDNEDIQSLSSDSLGLINGSIFIEAGVSISQLLAYALTLTDVKSSEGVAFIQNDTLDLGTLYIDEPNTPITFKKENSVNNIIADQIQVYSLNGKLLYNDKIYNLSKIIESGITLNQQVLIVRRFKGKVMSTSKVQFLK